MPRVSSPWSRSGQLEAHVAMPKEEFMTAAVRFALAVGVLLLSLPLTANDDFDAAGASAGHELAAGLATAPERASISAIAAPPLAEMGAAAVGFGARAAEAIGARLQTGNPGEP